MTRYAIVDLEATDVSSSNDRIKKIIQIGIVIMENGEVVDTFASDVNPHEKLSANISQLTGLRDSDLRQAPDFESLIPQILEKLQDAVFVAHNVKFDWGLLHERLAEFGVELELPKVDTVELARVFFPKIEKYGLEYLSNSLDLMNLHPHSALADAEETAELLKKIQQRVLKLPIAVLQEILRHADNFIYETRSLLDELIWDCQNQFSEFEVCGPVATLRTVESRSELRLAADFSENLAQLGLKKRKEQTLLAKIISEDLAIGGGAGSSSPEFAGTAYTSSTLDFSAFPTSPTFIEAQTGMGKTLAYLLPALATGRQVVVSTATKLLQDQVMTDLVPALAEKFSVKAVKLSSPRNYISLEKLRAQLKSVNSGKNSEIFKMKVLVWLTETVTGELAELSRNVTNPEMFEALVHDGRVREGTPHAVQDFWRKAEIKAVAADLIITNHAYLIEQLRCQSGLYRGAVLIVDEAQRLFTVLENSQQQSFNTIDELLTLELTSVPEKKLELQELMRLLETSNFDKTKIASLARNSGLSNLTKFLSEPERIYWTEGKTVKSSPAEFSDLQAMLPEAAKVIFVSGSMAFSEKHPLLPELLGFSNYKFYKLPAKQKTNQHLLTVTDGPAVNNSSGHDYAAYLADKLHELSRLDLPIVVLFSSQEMLDETAEALSVSDLSFAAQQKEQHDLLKKQFDVEKFQVLLATGAFWEGVDFDKQKRVILVIPRLPFATPDSILTRKYARKFENAFYDFNLPMAAMKLRQAIGRVNRKDSQKSVVLVLDGRLEKAKYSQALKRNLEEVLPVGAGEFEEILRKTKEFLQ